MKEFYTDTNFRPASIDLIGKIERLPDRDRGRREIPRRLIALIGKSRFSTTTCQQLKES
jgi:hypothetical protein